MDLRAHFGAIWRRRWLVLALAVVVAVGVFGLTKLEAPTYQAQAELSVTPAVVGSSGQGTSQDRAIFLASTYAQLASTEPVLALAARDSGLHITEIAAARLLTTTASTSLGFLTVTAKGPSAGAAQALARGLTQALLTTVTAQTNQSLQAELNPVEAEIKSVSANLQNANLSAAERAALEAEYQALVQAATTRQLQPADQLTVVAPARADPSPVAPGPKRDAVLAFLLALVLLSEGAAAVAALSDRFPAEALDEEVGRVTGVPLLAHVPEGGGEDTVEAFRTLRTNLLFMDEASQTRTVAVVSVDAGAGKSFIAVRLAAAMAELGVAAALIDGDMRRPVVHERLNIPRQPGLGNLLGGAEVSECGHLYPDEPNLLVIPAGIPLPDPAGSLSRHLTRRVLGPLAAARFIVIDTPAESVFPDAATIAANCDGTIVVIDASVTKRREARSMMARLRQVNANPIGAVVNRSANAPRSTAYYSQQAPPERPDSP